MFNRIITVLVSLGLALMVITLFSLNVWGDEEGFIMQLRSIFFGVDNDEPFHKRFFTIQNLMWVMFAIALGELCGRLISSNRDQGSLSEGLLHTEEHVIYTEQDVAQLRVRLANKDGLAAEWLKVLILRYQASSRSVDETQSMLNTLVEIRQFKLDVDYTVVRYLSWLIPTLGFIGTVVGIALALNYAGLPNVADDDNFLSEITSRLAVAFYTTLVALIMSSIVVLITHIVQALEERNIQKVSEYCLYYFVNKLISK